MTLDALLQFLRGGIKMSHIYQPVLIRTLLDNGGACTRRQLAIALLMQDESQIEYYENRLREMPLLSATDTARPVEDDRFMLTILSPEAKEARMRSIIFKSSVLSATAARITKTILTFVTLACRRLIKGKDGRIRSLVLIRTGKPNGLRRFSARLSKRDRLIRW
jgi:hypothetical protein